MEPGGDDLQDDFVLDDISSEEDEKFPGTTQDGQDNRAGPSLNVTDSASLLTKKRKRKAKDKEKKIKVRLLGRESIL